MKFQRKKVATTIAMLAGGTLSALAMAPAIAQTPDQPAGTMKVEVTGTNIRRVDSETNPVKSSRRKTWWEGYTSINVLRDITANSGACWPKFSRAFAGGRPASRCGPAALVLIDGLHVAVSVFG
jgi:hypothetical protein